GHRYSLDDVATAWQAVGARPDAERCLDLGCGIGSVLTMVAWKLRHARMFGVEALPISAELARRSAGDNGVASRTEMRCGGRREARAGGRRGRGGGRGRTAPRARGGRRGGGWARAARMPRGVRARLLGRAALLGVDARPGLGTRRITARYAPPRRRTAGDPRRARRTHRCRPRDARLLRAVTGCRRRPPAVALPTT